MYKNGTSMICLAANMAAHAMKDAQHEPTGSARRHLTTIMKSNKRIRELLAKRSRNVLNDAFDYAVVDAHFDKIDEAFDMLRMVGYLATETDRERKLIKVA